MKTVTAIIALVGCATLAACGGSQDDAANADANAAYDMNAGMTDLNADLNAGTTDLNTASDINATGNTADTTMTGTGADNSTDAGNTTNNNTL